MPMTKALIELWLTALLIVALAINMCLAGMVAAIRITSLLNMGMLRNTFVTSICRLTLLHAPAQMQVKNARAFRALLVVADENGDHLHVSPAYLFRFIAKLEYSFCLLELNKAKHAFDKLATLPVQSRGRQVLPLWYVTLLDVCFQSCIDLESWYFWGCNDWHRNRLIQTC